MWEIDDFILFRKIPRKDKWGYCDDIPLLPLLGSGHHLPLFLMSKHFFISIQQQKCINQISIGYIIDPTLHVKKVFRYQVEKILKETFHQGAIKDIKMLWKNIYMRYWTSNVLWN